MIENNKEKELENEKVEYGLKDLDKIFAEIVVNLNLGMIH
jgi:hypothetical protein